MRTKKVSRYNASIDREVEKSIVRFSEHLMSNSKWVRLIAGLVAGADTIEKIEFKKVQSKQIGELYIEADTTYGFDYWHNGIEGSNSFGGWLTFKEVEYLNFPKVVSAEPYQEQNLKAIVEIIARVGQFALEINDDSVRLICYRE